MKNGIITKEIKEIIVTTDSHSKYSLLRIDNELLCKKLGQKSYNYVVGIGSMRSKIAGPLTLARGYNDYNYFKNAIKTDIDENIIIDSIIGARIFYTDLEKGRDIKKNLIESNNLSKELIERLGNSTKVIKVEYY